MNEISKSQFKSILELQSTQLEENIKKLQQLPDLKVKKISIY